MKPYRLKRRLPRPKKRQYAVFLLLVLVLLSVATLLHSSESSSDGGTATEGLTTEESMEATHDDEPLVAREDPLWELSFAKRVQPPPATQRYSDTATTAWFDSSNEYVLVGLDPVPSSPGSTVRSAVYPRILLRNRNDETLEMEKKAHGKALGHSHVEWEGIYKPSESFELPTWATTPERLTLEHATVFVSIAAFRDSECAETLHSIFSRARSPHRIYAGVSEERTQSDVDCLSLLELKNTKFARELMWGKTAPSTVKIERREFTWDEVLEDQKIELISNVVKASKEQLSSSTGPTNAQGQCPTETPSLFYECNRVVVDKREECVQVWNQTLKTCRMANILSEEDCVKEYKGKMSACVEDTTPSYTCTVVELLDGAQVVEQLRAPHAPTVTDSKGQTYTCVKDSKPLHCMKSSNGTDPNRRGTCSSVSSGNTSSSAAPANSSTTMDGVPTGVFLDASYKRDRISCIAGVPETARDELLLALHGRLPPTHERYSGLMKYLDSLSAARRETLRQHFPLRMGAGPQQQPSARMAGCRVSTRVTPPESARGPTYGRFITSLFFFNQDYYMVVDSHSRMSVHWDNKMILRVFQMPTPGVLSHYPNGYLPEKPEGEFEREEVMGMCKGVILANAMPKLGCNWMPLRPHPTLEAFAAAGYLFGDAQFTLDTPFDPFLPYLFDGEEILYSVRMWTHGWDIYSPAEANIFHYYERSNAPKFWSLMTSTKLMIQAISEQRALYLLERAQPWVQDKARYGKDAAYVAPSERRVVPESVARATPRISLMKAYFGMGKKRSIEEFLEYAQLSDQYVSTRDFEDRWEGGQELCRRQKGDN